MGLLDSRVLGGTSEHGWQIYCGYGTPEYGRGTGTYDMSHLHNVDMWVDGIQDLQGRSGSSESSLGMAVCSHRGCSVA